MATATVTSKGQITIPQKVRAALGVGFGDRIDFVELEKGQFMIIPATHSIKELKGFIKKRGKPVTIEEMNGAVALRNLNSSKR